MPDISQRPYLPPILSNPMMGGMSLPLGGGSRLPPNPSPAAQVATPNSTAADAGGIQQAMAKRGTIEILKRAGVLLRDLKDPESLSVNTSDEGEIPVAEMHRKPRLLARPFMSRRKALTDALELSAIMQPEMMERDQMTGEDARMFGLNLANRHPKRFRMTPEAQEATSGDEEKEAAQDSSADRLSATGTKSGVTYKTDEDGSKTGTSAFDTLDGYMKKAGLNSFQAQFFAGLAENGLDEAQVRGCVKAAGDRFGPEVGQELTQGLEQLEKAGGLASEGLKLGWNALKWGGRKAMQSKNFLNLPVSSAAKVTGTGVKNFGKTVARKVAEKAPALANAGKAVATGTGNVVRTAGNVAKGTRKVLGSDTTVGALTGATNPYTGFGSEGSYNPDGSINYRQAFLNTLGGATLGSLGGKNIRGRMWRADLGNAAGEFGTRGLNWVGDSTGNEYLQSLDPNFMGRVGFGLGGMTPGRNKGKLPAANPMSRTGTPIRNAPSPVAGKVRTRRPGRRTSRTTLPGRRIKPPPVAPVSSAGSRIAPVSSAGSRIAQGTRNAGNAILDNKVKLGLGTAATVAAGYGVNEGVNAVNDIKTEVNNFKTDANETMQTVQNAAAEGREQLKKLDKTRSKVDNVMDGGIGGMIGGEGGWGGILSGLMSGEGGGMAGDIGGYIKKNPWLLPLLLSGGGAAGGYALGGKGGAALGGIGAPLLYALMSGQLGNPQGTGGGGKTIDDNAAIARAAEAAKIKEQIESGNIARVPQGEKAPESELARGQKAQAAYPQPNRGQLMLNQGG